MGQRLTDNNNNNFIILYSNLLYVMGPFNLGFRLGLSLGFRLGSRFDLGWALG